MATFFDKPIHQINSDDVSELIHSAWPESYTLEFKQALPHKGGGIDAWDQGRGYIGEYARDELFAEVVGLANSDGGFVVLGIEETRDKPPRASKLSLQNNVRELAARFEDAARVCIDPPISMLAVHPIEFDGGQNGVVVFKVNASRLAPHRVVGTRECYLRRGTSNVKMAMREIQEMSVSASQLTEKLDQNFLHFSSVYQHWRRDGDIVSYRVTAIPHDRIPDAGRLVDPSKPFQFFNLRRFSAKIGKGSDEFVMTSSSSYTERPIMRGVKAEVTTNSGRYRLQHFQTGEIDLCFAHSGAFPGETQTSLRFYHGWLLGGVANVLQMIADHRKRVGYGDAEYGLQVEIVRPIGSGISYMWLGDGHYSSDLPVGTIETPIIPVGGPETFNSVINTIDTDIFDALGERKGMPDPIIVDWY